jgi:hypothetical protein
MGFALPALPEGTYFDVGGGSGLEVPTPDQITGIKNQDGFNWALAIGLPLAGLGAGALTGALAGGGAATAGGATAAAPAVSAAAPAVTGVGAGTGAGLGTTAASTLPALAKSGFDWTSILGPAIGAGTGILGTKMQADASRDAAAMQLEAADKALNFEREERDYQRGINKPFVDTGTQATGNLSEYLGEPFEMPTLEEVLNSPGAAFRLNYANQGFDRLKAAQGRILSGGTLAARDRMNQDLASQEYQNYFQNSLARRQQNVGENQSAVEAALRAAGNSRTV